jgi:hypothetical protein
MSGKHCHPFVAVSKRRTIHTANKKGAAFRSTLMFMIATTEGGGATQF